MPIIVSGSLPQSVHVFVYAAAGRPLSRISAMLDHIGFPGYVLNGSEGTDQDRIP
ncbi:hypothetical protein BHAOGJBA_1148 [Methylobacterium hispanicum]|uniref:Uncharacterized protein n=1 Tax=Methylobacterium hispanicum TaxID=270350 RepID=A0AAV4ZHH7_9HYPH|nr:hypothetical protein BHAOGJBA_1148 [Methylobacterium hispanicum]